MTKQSVSAAVKAGRITLVDGLIDPVRAEREWAANTDPAPPMGLANRGAPGKRRTRGADPEAMAYAAGRAAEKTAKAKLMELELATRQGAMVPADEVRKRSFEQGRRARNLLKAIPARMSGVLAGISSPAEIERRLNAEIDAVCAEIARESK